AANQHAVRAQMCLTEPAMETRAAVKLGVDDDAVPGPERLGVAGVDDFPEQFMTHDSRVADRNRAAENLEIGAADAAVRHADLHLAGVPTWPSHVIEDQIPGCAQDHGSHRGVMKLCLERPSDDPSASESSLPVTLCAARLRD